MIVLMLFEKLQIWYKLFNSVIFDFRNSLMSTLRVASNVKTSFIFIL